MISLKLCLVQHTTNSVFRFHGYAIYPGSSFGYLIMHHTSGNWSDQKIPVLWIGRVSNGEIYVFLGGAKNNVSRYIGSGDVDEYHIVYDEDFTASLHNEDPQDTKWEDLPFFVQERLFNSFPVVAQ